MICKTRSALCLAIATAAVFPLLVHAQLSGGPFTVDAQVESANGQHLLEVEIGIPDGHYLYADKLQVRALGGARLEPVDTPEPEKKFDKFLEKDLLIYSRSTNFTFRIDEDSAGDLEIAVDYQGCGPDVCFPPSTANIGLGTAAKGPAASAAEEQGGEAAPAEDAPAADLRQKLQGFQVAGKTAGYLNAEEFIGFLDRAESGDIEAEESDSMLAGKGVLVILLLVLAGGMALNLTPCVLPMIPVNIAVIGAGAQAESKTRGLLLGATYGVGIALAYGVLGVVVVLTGARFGDLNSSPWFNFAVAAVFLLLGLSMLGLFNLDFTRFQPGVGKRFQGKRFITAFVLGVVAALLAGACVAPVVISVLLYALALYSDGNIAGLFLPFLLGIGMGLPWPFAGAGLSWLPKTGAWMEKVKYAFGAIILLAALYYGKLGYDQLRPRQKETQTGKTDATVEWMSSLDAALQQSKENGKPVLLDFWGPACKSCVKMDKTTFKNPEVAERLESYATVKLDTARDDPTIQAAQERFARFGIPVYVVLRAQERE